MQATRMAVTSSTVERVAPITVTSGGRLVDEGKGGGRREEGREGRETDRLACNLDRLWLCKPA